jgi:hypothetical protein
MKRKISRKLLLTMLLLVILAETFAVFVAIFAAAFADSDPGLSDIWSTITTTSPSADSLWHDITTSTPVRARNSTSSTSYTTYIGPDGRTYYKQIGQIWGLMIVVDFPDAISTNNNGTNGIVGTSIPPMDYGNRVHGHVLLTAQDYYDYLMPRAQDFFNVSSYGQLYFNITLVKNPNATDGVFTTQGLLYSTNQYNSIYGTGNPYAMTRGGDVTSYVRDALTQAKPVLSVYPDGPYDILYVVAVEDAPGISYGPTDMSGSTANSYSGRTDFKALVRVGFDSYTRWRTKAVNHETSHTLGDVDYYINAFSGYGTGQCDPNVGTADYYPMIGHWDLMGYINGPAPDYTAWTKWRFGWVADNQVAIDATSGTTTYQLTPVETPGGTKLIIIPGPLKGTVFCIEMRAAAGVDNTAVREVSTDPDPSFPNTNWAHIYGAFNSTGILMYKIDANVASLSGPLTVIDLYPNQTSTELGTRLDSSVLGATSGIYSYTDPAAGITVTLTNETPTVDTVTVTYNLPHNLVKPVLSQAHFIDYETIEFQTSLDLRGIARSSIVLRRSSGSTVSGVTINQITPNTIRITFSSTAFTSAAATVGATVSTNAFSFFNASDPATVTPLNAPVLSNAYFHGLTEIVVNSNMNLTGLPASNINITKPGGTTVPSGQITNVTFNSVAMLLTVDINASQFPTYNSTVGTTIATTGMYSNYVPSALDLTMARWNPPVITSAPSAAVTVSMQYYLTVASLYDTQGGMGWYNVGATAYATLSTGTVDIVPGWVKAVFTGWSGDASGTGLTSNPITMNGSKTAIANWVIQYYLQVVSDPSLIPPMPGADWYNNCTYVMLTADTYYPSEAGAGGVRYVFNYWDVDAASQGTGVNPIDVYMDAPHTATAHYVTQYYLTMSTNFGTVSPASGWYDSGTVLTIQATAPPTGAGEQYVWNGWTGTGTGSFTGMDNPATNEVTMNGPITEAASWTHQYMLTLSSAYDTPTGAGWYDAGATATFGMTDTTVPGGAGAQYVFTGWSSSDSGGYTGTDVSHSVTMNGPITETANWKTQYYLTVNSPYDTPSGSGWYDSGTTAYASLANGVVSGGTGIQYVFTSWGGDASGTNYAQSDGITMNGPRTATANWKTQYYLTVTTSPLGVNSPAGQGWYDSGVTAHVSTAQYVDIVPGSSRYRFDSWTGATGTYADATVYMDAPKTATANYVVQYKLTVSTSPGGLTPQPAVSLSSGYTTGDGYYDTGSVVSIDPNSPAGYTFDHWSGDASGAAAPLSVTMTSAKNIVAVYTFNLNVVAGFKAGDSPSYASDPYLDDILCVLTQVTGGYKLAGTSPGTYDYAIAVKNVGTTTFTSISININGHGDFCLQSSNPIRVLDASGSDITAQFALSGTWPTITISSKPTFTGLSASTSLYVTVHLDYALKGQIFGSSTYDKGYTFTVTVSGTSGANQGSNNAYGSVAVLSKKATVICGFVTDSNGKPIAGAEVDLYNGAQLLWTDHTDADGFYSFIDGVDGVSLKAGVTYTVKCTLPSGAVYMQNATAVSQKAVIVNFKKQ